MSLVDLENAAIGVLSNMQDRTPAIVRETLQLFLRMPTFRHLAAEIKPEQLELAAKSIESKLFIGMRDAAKIQLPFDEWLPQRRVDTKMYFYPRYRNWLENKKGFPPAVMGVLDKDTDKIVGLLENPQKLGSWKRRGLVVGHVQSGKTANYTGVICKAADYGYRFIVVLSGIQEDLRIQTQERIEEGFIGISSEATGEREARIGVGDFGLDHRPMSLTSRDDDFKSSQARLAVPIQSLSEPLVLVMKKNTRILANLIEWLKTKSQESGGRISEVPMLLIDDEADNASVNFSPDMESPSTTNRRLRELLDLFDKNVYMGYTATPFANIFIDPESVDSMNREDLFPRHFIVSLDAPTNYFGASRVFAEDGDLHGSLRQVDDHRTILPERHKITHDPKAMPGTMEEAIRSFILAQAVRFVRGHGKSHSSMLVNVSRFNDVQTKITGLVNNCLSTIRYACQGHAKLSEKEALKDPEICELRRVWDLNYAGSIPESWMDIQRWLPESVGPIEVRKINSKSQDSLDYRRYKENGLHVIAVGGFVLSRGFTLEGLIVSYFLRNSVMYDTLLQMGRWFGFRDGYEDLCRIYMTPGAISWYSHICEAIEELRDEFKRMERLGKSPEEFGLRVRSHPDTLIVTARNKMRSGRVVRHKVALGGTLIETTALRRDVLSVNRETLNTVVQRLNEIGSPDANNGLGYLWKSVPAIIVKEFLQLFRNHNDACLKTQSEPVIAYISAREANELGMWDVCLYSPTRGDGREVPVGPHQVREQIRAATWEAGRIGPGYLAVSGAGSRVASRGAERAGMSTEEIERARKDFYSKEGNEKKSMSDKAYRMYRTRPLLMLHLLELRDDSGNGEDQKIQINEVVAWGISFPGTNVEDTQVEYVVNTTWWNENFGDDMKEYEEELQDA